jgi:hypothetical protein
MGSIVGTVGDRAGAKILLTAGQNLVLSSFPSLTTPAPAGYYYVAFEFGWTKFVFQIVPGNATAGTFMVNVTNDQPTAQQSPGNLGAWEQMPSPVVEGSTVVWTNPLTLTAGGRLFYVNSGPWAAFQIAVAGYAGTTGYLLFAAEP